jgi:hypothetical protein
VADVVGGLAKGATAVRMLAADYLAPFGRAAASGSGLFLLGGLDAPPGRPGRPRGHLGLGRRRRGRRRSGRLSWRLHLGLGGLGLAFGQALLLRLVPAPGHPGHQWHYVVVDGEPAGRSWYPLTPVRIWAPAMT